ncbi:DNA repair protein RAD50 [Termitomyces sp. J132]|nr:DNA repair protein RAD50 [Termitomyces sp. J132]
MASLNKLAIRGIRSFDDKQISVIEFFSPVTVIVGHNGSGKTTIIECLKYATTGDQPPNTRGGAFVHDPKMANEKEVKAQVKLRFHAANGTRMLAVRNLSVTVKKTSGFTMKTLESILALADGNAEKGGKRGVISTKCAEMDTEIPQLLGVSKAVLENVIFCHQEDSWWPLAEPSALKKKFDDIFEATRYTKALDNIKSLRKDRIADLKAENERLQSLAREKAHADKLRERISQLNATIAEKQVEYEQTKKEYEVIVEANQKFYDYATKFRELFVKYEALDGKKARLHADLDEAKLNLQEIVGTDEELELRLRRFDEHINAQKQRKRVEDTKKQDLEDELTNVRKQHTELTAQHGGLVAEAEAQDQRLAEREQLIHEVAEKHGIKGFNVTPLEREKVVDFLSKLNEMKNKHRTDLEKLQSDLRTKTEEYAHKQRMMDNELSKHKLEKENLREQIIERQKTIKKDERKLENLITIPSQLKTLQDDMDEKRARLTKHKTDMSTAQYDVKLTEVLSKVKVLEDRRELLNNELRTLGLQSDVRAKLNLAKEDIKTKGAEILNTLELANVKIRKLTKEKDVTVDTLEPEVNRLTAGREQRCEELERLANTANNNVSKAEATISNAKAQLKTKKDELRVLERRLKNEVEGETLEAAIKEAVREAGHRKQLDGNLSGGGAVYANLLRVGRQQKMCAACNRHLTDEEFKVFEKHMEEMKKKASPEAIEDNKNEMQEWESELERLQSLRPVDATCHQLKTKDIPALEKEIKELEDSYPDLTREAEEAVDDLDAVKRELKEIGVLKEHIKTIARLRGEVSRAKDDVAHYETELQASGSVKTADDVQRDLDDVTIELRSLEREKSQITTERERQKEALRLIENSIHEMEMKEKDLISEVKEKEKVEKSIAEMQQEIITFTNRTKEFDVKISEARAPIDALEEERRKSQNDMNVKISQAQHAAQEFNSSVDKLALINKGVERYVKDRRARQLTECAQNIEHSDAEIKRLSEDIEAARTSIAAIEKEINASGASVANYRDNIRVRKLAKDIIETQAEMDACNMDEAAKAKRNFEEKYPKAKEKENKLQTNYSHIAGEVSSHQSQLKALEADLKEFEDINKKYTEQLIRVKASSLCYMANSDLEKYAKALDNAIMKYHGLKMEEVNDTMKHLWNKTYQGTDIDGIKIRSDVEGGASKRSYNYRVVMTKDQVEMDMRGRCSAGQKMLASIIIRLALSDSFGQNCGILALDEPTNALDTENIDALAASLVDIINERKSHSNFQLIIITHDENFLRKLGQADVMEYYWRVSRDSRQKSVIERQRFR